MDGKISSGEKTPNLPQELDELKKELDAMPLEQLEEELEILWDEMDEDSVNQDLLDAYLDAIDRKSPSMTEADIRESYQRFLNRLEEQEPRSKRRGFRGALKAGVIVAAVVALLAACVVIAHASWPDFFDRIARWTAETFGFAPANAADLASAELPPQLKGMKDALKQYGIGEDYLPQYWPEGYEQSKVSYTEEPMTSSITGAYGETGNRIVLTYIFFQSDIPTESYNIDNQELEIYEHNGIQFHVMKNTEKYLAVWTSGNVECRVSGLASREELLKILDSIGG